MLSMITVHLKDVIHVMHLCCQTFIQCPESSRRPWYSIQINTSFVPPGKKDILAPNNP